MSEAWKPSARARLLLTIWAIANLGTLIGGTLMLALGATAASDPAWLAGLALSCGNAALQCVAVVGLLSHRGWGRIAMRAAAVVNVIVAMGALGTLAWMLLGTGGGVSTAEVVVAALLAVMLVGWLGVWAALARRLRRGG